MTLEFGNDTKILVSEDLNITGEAWTVTKVDLNPNGVYYYRLRATNNAGLTVVTRAISVGPLGTGEVNINGDLHM